MEFLFDTWIAAYLFAVAVWVGHRVNQKQKMQYRSKEASK